MQWSRGLHLHNVNKYNPEISQYIPKYSVHSKLSDNFLLSRATATTFRNRWKYGCHRANLASFHLALFIFLLILLSQSVYFVVHRKFVSPRLSQSLYPPPSVASHRWGWLICTILLGIDRSSSTLETNFKETARNTYMHAHIHIYPLKSIRTYF